jgi:hypothetical protein
MPNAHVGAVRPTESVSNAHMRAASAMEAAGAIRANAASTNSIAGPGTRTAGASEIDQVLLRTQAKAALVGLGWKPAIAGAAIADATAAMDRDSVTLERLIFESLRRCPVPRK